MVAISRVGTVNISKIKNLKTRLAIPLLAGTLGLGTLSGCSVQKEMPDKDIVSITKNPPAQKRTSPNYPLLIGSAIVVILGISAISEMLDKNFNNETTKNKQIKK